MARRRTRSKSRSRRGKRRSRRNPKSDWQKIDGRWVKLPTSISVPIGSTTLVGMPGPTAYSKKQLRKFRPAIWVNIMNSPQHYTKATRDAAEELYYADDFS